jgi:hypothetical protein
MEESDENKICMGWSGVDRSPDFWNYVVSANEENPGSYLVCLI